MLVLVLAGAQLALPLVVRVTDSLGHGVAGVAVRWEQQDPTASVIALAAATDAAGEVSARYVVGARGAVTVSAAVALARGAAPAAEVSFTEVGE